MKKAIRKIVLSLFLLMILPKTCLAGGWNVTVPTFDDDGTTTPTDEDGNFTYEWAEGDITYTCKYKYHVNAGSSVNVYGFNQQGKSIINGDGNVIPEESIKAGTSIGLNITESKSASYGVDFYEVTAVKTIKGQSGYNCCYRYKCKHCPTMLESSMIKLKLPIIVLRAPQLPKCTTYYSWTKVDSTCTSVTQSCSFSTTKISNYYCYETSKDDETENVDVPEEKKTECLNKAKDVAISVAKGALLPSYQLSLYDPNAKSNEKPKIIKNIDTTPCNVKISRSVTSQTCDYDYNPAKVCINLQTATVTYRQSSTESCGSNEIEVPKEKNGNITYWKYFVPLDFKAKDQFFTIALSPRNATGVQPKKFCLKVMEKYPNYNMLIAAPDGSQLPANADESDVANGCIITSRIPIEVDQKFYNETTKDNKSQLIGYNLFYRQIDIANPFPNGISKDSYWNGLIKNNVITTTNASNKTATYNLDDSFKSISYSIYNINASAIRAYNKDNFYTSWKNMNVDGSSQFVQNYNMRNGSQKYYKLGCGPANSNWEGCK